MTIRNGRAETRDEFERFNAFRKANCKETPELQGACREWWDECLESFGPLFSLKICLATDGFINSLGPPDSDLRAKFMRIVQLADAAYTTDLAAFNAAEAYRSTMLKDEA